MPNDPERPHEITDEQDRRMFDVFDQYVQALHAGDEPSRDALLRQHPQLREYLQSLDTLEMLAPPSAGAGSGEDSESHSAAADTVLFEESNVGSSPEMQSIRTKGRRDFGKYELLEEIGRGGMGVVYRARQKDLDRIVALKMILSSHLASDEQVRRFYAEAKAAGGLRHPHIVGIHEVGACHGQHYFAMDFVEGDSLAHRLRDGPLPPEKAADCLAGIARAVDYLHQHQIVHRDLKPSNILLDVHESPYVTDFGLAKVFSGDSQQTQSGTILGTPSYMAPEQAAGRSSEISPRSDVYSLGAILYELLTGRPPFQRDNPLDTLVEVLEGEPTLPSRIHHHVPQELEWICLRCLEKDPQMRYGSAAELAEDLERYLRRDPVEARPSGLVQAVKRWSRREPALVSRLGGLLAAAGIVQGKYMYSGYDLPFHLKVMGLFGLWAFVSLIFQRLLHRETFTDVVRFAWSAADVLLLTTHLFLAEPPIGPVLVGYPLLIVASGLFFQVRLVWFTTIVSLVSYAGLLLLRDDQPGPAHYPIIFAAVLAVLGFVVAYQVYRVRVLSRFYESRRLP